MRDDLEIPPPGYRVGRRPAGIDPATRRLSIIAASIGGALVILVGIWSIVGGGSGGVPVVPAPAGPMRVKPAHPGGMQVTGGAYRILGNGSATTTQATLAPPPETPDLSALQSPPAAASAAQPAAPPAAASARAAAATQAHARQTAARPAAASLPLPPAPPPPLQLAAASTAAPPPEGAGTGSATEVQLAAMNSEQGARREWQRLQGALPTLFDQRQPVVEKVEVDGHTFWRLRTGGFANVAAATEFCTSVRAKGNGCTIAAF
ncbi:MAG: SPOR domain-containing protein [Acetobacteraceae bacterium]